MYNFEPLSNLFLLNIQSREQNWLHKALSPQWIPVNFASESPRQPQPGRVTPGLTCSLCPPLNVLWRGLLFKLRPHFLQTFIESGSDNIIMSGKSENKSNFTQYIKQFGCRQTKINLWSQKMIITYCQKCTMKKVSKVSAEEKIIKIHWKFISSD